MAAYTSRRFVFSAVWWVWLSTTIFVNRFRMTDLGHRLLVLVQMFLVTLVAVAVGDGVPKHPGWAGPLAGALLGGYALRTLIRAAGGRWLHLGTDTVAVMGGIAFWGMLIGWIFMLPFVGAGDWMCKPADARAFADHLACAAQVRVGNTDRAVEDHAIPGVERGEQQVVWAGGLEEV